MTRCNVCLRICYVRQIPAPTYKDLSQFYKQNILPLFAILVQTPFEWSKIKLLHIICNLIPFLHRLTIYQFFLKIPKQTYKSRNYISFTIFLTAVLCKLYKVICIRKTRINPISYISIRNRYNYGYFSRLWTNFDQTKMILSFKLYVLSNLTLSCSLSHKKNILCQRPLQQIPLS